MARATVEAESFSAVVNVNLTVRSCPSVDTDAQISTLLVVTGGAILARAQSRTLVNIHSTEATWPSQSIEDHGFTAVFNLHIEKRLSLQYTKKGHHQT